MDNKTQNTIQNTAGIGLGLGAYYGTKKILTNTNRMIINKLEPKLTPQQIDTFKKAVYQVHETQGLKNRGLVILDTSKLDFETYSKSRLNLINQFYDHKLSIAKNSIQKYIINLKRNFILKNARTLDLLTFNGQNAYFNKIAKPEIQNGKATFRIVEQVVINMEKNPIFAFHEFGHAKNYSNKNFEKLLQKYFKNPFVQKAALGVILATALLTPKQDKNQKNHKNNIFTQIGSTIKNNCGILAFIVMLPNVLEEGLASLNGQKMANKILDKANLKTLTKSHLLSFGSYLSFAIITALSMSLANKIKDEISQGKKAKNSQQLS